MRETRVRSLRWEDPLEKEIATHSGILAWRIPRTEEPGGLQSIGWQSWTRLSNFTSLHFQLKDRDNCSWKTQSETFGMTLDKYGRAFMCLVNPNENYSNHFLIGSVRTFLFIYLVTYRPCQTASEILVPRPEVEPMHPAVEA